MGRSSLWSALRATHYAPLSLRAQVSIASSGEEALRQVRHTPPDVVLLDLMLPAIGGLEVCRTLRQEPSTAALPIVMLTAKGDEVFKIPIPQNAPKHSASGR